MEKDMEMLKDIGFSASERKRIRAHYRGNPSCLREYVLYMRAILDDRHEYRS